MSMMRTMMIMITNFIINCVINFFYTK